MGFLSKKEKSKKTSDGTEEEVAPVAPPPAPKASYTSLYRYATPYDKFLIALGSLSAMVNGAGLPLMTIVFGDIMTAFITYSPAIPGAQAKLDDAVRIGVIWLTVIGAGTFLASYGQICFWMIAGENQARRLRTQYFRAIMRQDVGWFDATSTGELTTRMVSDTATIQEGISEKIGLMIQFSCTFVAGFVIAFVNGWQLALVLCSVFPLLAAAAGIMSYALSGGSSAASDAYAAAGNIAQQSISAIRTVSAFGGQEREASRYEKELASAEKAGLKGAFVNGAGVGFIQGLIFAVYALAFWYGNTLVPDTMESGKVLTVFFSIIIGAFSLGQATPYISVIGNAQGAAHKVFSTLDRVSPIDACTDDGKRLEKLKGDITFKDVNFHYPTRTDVPILKNFSLEVQAGQTVALVGASGSGKSTIVKLLERFYNPVSGTVLVDGVDISDLNVRWLREHIGIVSQEPALFDTTIRQNLIYGLTEDVANIPLDVLDKKIEEACKTANAWTFIQALPEGLDTNVGEAGSMMSGGQKQRICIARAIMRNPQILLLDEATSALDTESERIVQAALDNASKNRTTVVIAHRLSTVKNADLILVMSKGVVVESGTHNSLIEKGGVYFDLTEAQKIREAEEVQKHGASPTRTVSPSTASPDGVESAETFGNAADESAVHIMIPTSQLGSKIKSTSMDSLKRKRLQEKEKEEEKALRLKQKVDVKRVLILNKPEWWMFFVGGIAAVGNGVVMPLFAIIFSSILTALGTPDANFWALMFVVLSIAAFISNFLQIALFKYAGEKLTRRLRNMSFRAILRQEIGFFDEEKHTTGVLLTRLAEDASLVQGLTGQTFGAIIQALAGLITGLVIAFYYSWRLTFVVVATIPLIGLAGYFQLRALSGYGQASRSAYEDAGQIACEAIENVRTVATLTQEKYFTAKYESATQHPHEIAVKGSLISSLGFGFSQGVIFWSWAVAFYYGARLITWDIQTPGDVLKVMFSIIFTAMAAGQVSNFTPDGAKAKLAALNIFEILDSKSKIDYTDKSGQVREKCEGKADLVKVEFCYPIRPDTRVLKGLEVEAKPGHTIALVGASGCGKSTVLGILERWYDIAAGTASVDELSVKDWNLSNLRSHMALVGQEPILFNTSIRNNIAYGLPGEATQLQIETAAKSANIHDFVVTLPEGYNTIVGEKGGQLSGGQKQRVAIARALIRNPRLLLLDEATSALDSESEKVVQKALDEASKGRTTLVIAHRLSTIQNADTILVVKDGVVAESGTHDRLVSQKGLYYELAKQQSLDKH